MGCGQPRDIVRSSSTAAASRCMPSAADDTHLRFCVVSVLAGFRCVHPGTGHPGVAAAVHFGIRRAAE